MTVLIMPVAGMGSRFSMAGYATPKPMMPLDGLTFVEWAWLSATRCMDITKTIFVARPEHLRMGLDTVLLRAAPDADIVPSDGRGAGAVADAALALPGLAAGEAVAINDCDHAFTVSRRLDDFTGSSDGVSVVGFPSSNPAHGFGLLSGRAHGDLLGIVEKRVAGPLAVGGCYVFSSARLLGELVTQALPRAGQGEFYASRLVNEATGRGIAATMHPARDYLPFGTPAELERLRHGQVRRMFA